MGGDRAKAYPDRETAEARFRLYPPQPCANAFVLKYIAKQSVMRIDGGAWAWKFDEDLPGTLKGGERYPEEYAGYHSPLELSTVPTVSFLPKKHSITCCRSPPGGRCVCHRRRAAPRIS
ncbi:MAG: hypothetical protein CM1200mP9_00610 [Gammaproteobacteria bacterium]|nr:MAG: hypothetical protein CM1200mP9_00610 [Gammaproteobacteria bacterium]